MAASVDYGLIGGVTDGIYQGMFGIYNEFIAAISTGEVVRFKHSFRIRVTVLNDTNVTYTLNVDSVQIGSSFYANVNPVANLRELYFDSEYSGLAEFTSNLAYSGVKIEIGESYADTADEPPTFQGYDTDNTFYFYNGYEKPETAGQKIGLNYRESKWYDETPHLLPKVKKTLYLLEGDLEILSIPNYLNVYPVIPGTSNNLKNFVTEIYNEAGVLQSTSTINLRLRPDFDTQNIGYFNFESTMNPILGAGEYAEVYVQWVSNGVAPPSEEGFANSERITIRRLECNPKNENYRLKWINRYGGEEFQNFQLKADKSIQIKRGKKIASTGIDFDATTFADIQNINNPNLREYGKESYTRYTLRTDFITQEEINAMDELFKSSNVVLVNNNEPVIVEDSTYKILDVKDELQRVEIRVRLANKEPNQV